jgi:hypothetical protein
MDMQIWRLLVAYVAEAVLEGISNSKNPCSAIGRNAMFSDVQETLHSMKTMAPLQSAELAAVYDIQSRLLGSYVKVTPLLPSGHTVCFPCTYICGVFPKFEALKASIYVVVKVNSTSILSYKPLVSLQKAPVCGICSSLLEPLIL